MNKLKIIKDTKIFVKNILIKEGTGHDWWHIERVKNNAKSICKNEKVDNFIVEMAILLHDVGDRKVIKKSEDDYTIAENYLISKKIDSGVVERIMFIIKNMSFSHSLGKNKATTSKEFCVVQDADRLDALGAIGIARAFAFGGSRGRPLYDPEKKAQKYSSREKYIKGSDSSFNHFYEKILLLKDLMNTKTAKKIAKERHEFIKNYMKQFILEWEGKR